MSVNRLPPSPRPRLDEGEEIRVHDLWTNLLRQRWFIVGVTGAVLLLTAFYTWRQEPVYDSEATVHIDERRSSQQALLSDLAPLMPSGTRIETEMAVLRSRRIAEAVVDSLQLTVGLVEPARPREEVLTLISAPRDAETGGFLLTHQQGDLYHLKQDDGKPVAEAPREVRIGTPFRLGTVTLALAPGLRADPPPQIRVVIYPFRSRVGSVRSRLSIYKPDPFAQVLGIRYQSPDPNLAAAVPNAVAHTFIAYKTATTKEESQSTVQFLRNQVSSYEQDLDAAETRLRAFRESEQVVSLTDEASQQVRRLAELQARLDEQRAERESLTGLLTRIRQQPRSGSGPSAYRQLASFPVFLSNRAVQDMLQALINLENQRSQLMVDLQPDHRDVQGVNERISEIELQLYQLATNYLEGLNSQISSNENALVRFGTQLEQIPAREVQFARLSRQQDLLAQIYTLLQTRLKEAEIGDAAERSNVRVIDSALVPGSPISPRPMRNMILGGILGLMLGVGLAFARQALNTKVRSRDDLEDATHGAPVLGMIPRIRVANVASTNGNGNGRHNGNGASRWLRKGRVVPFSPAMLLEERLITRLDPHAPASEAYRALRTNITFSNAETPPRVIVVTSAMPGDGKTTSASNLAITFAQQGTRTLLVDADLRRGVLHKSFAIPQEPGLTHVLMDRASLEEAVVTVPVGDTSDGLYLLPAGVFPPNPAELLGSARMRELLKTLRERFDIIVFDAPPMNLVTDAGVLGTLADSTLLVARSGTTQKRALEHAASQIYLVGAHLGGVIMNDVDFEGEGRYYGYGYGYGYGYSQRPVAKT